MSGNRRHAGGMKSAMENLKRYDEARKAQQPEPKPDESRPGWSYSERCGWVKDGDTDHLCPGCDA